MSSANSMTDLIRAIRVRERASDLLHRLQADRERLEVTLEEAGREDQLKTVTGRSALDNAILSTRRVIESVDQMLETSRTPQRSAAVQAALRVETPSRSRAGATVGI